LHVILESRVGAQQLRRRCDQSFTTYTCVLNLQSTTSRTMPAELWSRHQSKDVDAG
jgi:hypothetical protein